MTTDTLNRRVRSAAPQPRVQRLELTEADYLIFAALDRHGPLPSTYLYEFTKHIRRDRTHLQNRLTEFFNGDARGSYLTRPPQQFANYRARYQHLVYDLVPRARYLLAERGLCTPYGDRRSDPFVHRLMTACVAASIDLIAPTQGVRYIPLRDILSHSPCGASLSDKNPLALPVTSAGQTQLIPDMVFGLEYPGHGYRFFAVEIDRNTESIERRNLSQSAFARKLAGYEAVLRLQSFRAWWGVPNLHVLTVTTSETHAAAILRHAGRNLDPAFQGKFAISVASTFGADWRVPGAPMSELLISPWNTVTHATHLFRP